MRVWPPMSGGVDSAVAAARAVAAGHDVVGVHLALSADAGRAAHGLARLLLAGGRRRRPAGRRRARHPVLRVGLRRPVHRRRRRRLRRRLRRGPDPEPVPAVQREDQVLRRCWTGRSRWASTRSAPATTRSCTDGRAAARRRRRQGPVVRAGRADRRAAAARDVPAGRHGQGRRCGRRPRRAGCGWPTSPTATTSASSPPATPAASSPPASAPARGRWSTPGRVRCWPATTACTGSPSASGAGLGLGRPAADGRPRYVLGIEPVSGTVRVGPAEALDVQRRRGARRRVDRRRRAVRPRRVHGAGTRARRPGARDGVPSGGDLRVELGEPLRGVAPGQAVALYRPDPAGDVVLGSATITAAR